MEDSLIPIVLAIVAAIIGAISQGKKKTFSAPGESPQQEEYPSGPGTPMPEAEVILKRILQEMAPEPPPPAPAKVPVQREEGLAGDLDMPAELKRQRDLLMALEGSRALQASEQYQYDEIHDDIAASEIKDVEEDRGPREIEIAGVGTWDSRKAVVFSEILNRRPGL